MLGSLADRQEIRELIERYADAVMRFCPEDWAATWADADAEWIFVGHPQLSATYGKANIVENWTTRMAEHPPLHFQVQIGVIKTEEYSAIARSYTVETFNMGMPDARQVYGRYEDQLVKEANAWKFRRRCFTFLSTRGAAS